MGHDLELKKISNELKEINQQLLNVMSSILYCRSLIKEANEAQTNNSTEQKLSNDN